MNDVILITGSGFGELAAKLLAGTGYLVYASMRRRNGLPRCAPSTLGGSVNVIDRD
jgi:NADP-dependent 3-hydroxy acid dehydrogenase YdfG